MRVGVCPSPPCPCLGAMAYAMALFHVAQAHIRGNSARLLTTSYSKCRGDNGTSPSTLPCEPPLTLTLVVLTRLTWTRSACAAGPGRQPASRPGRLQRGAAATTFLYCYKLAAAQRFTLLARRFKPRAASQERHGTPGQGRLWSHEPVSRPGRRVASARRRLGCLPLLGLLLHNHPD